jgi:mannose-6-phosphate isomerase-like protein (cupin superfamily)
VIRKADAVKVVKASGLRGGKGEVEMRQLLEADKDEFNGKGRLFAHNVLKPGTSIGWHQHVGDSEAYYILRGQALVNDNGTEVTVSAGDVVLTQDGEYHSIENNGDQDLEFIALILYA